MLQIIMGLFREHFHESLNTLSSESIRENFEAAFLTCKLLDKEYFLLEALLTH
jgi:hypothetical protein